MLNKNDPLIGAVQEVMKRNQTEREATRLVNEKFRVEDRKALPHEKQGEWDAAYQQILAEGLHPNQQKLDVHEPEKDKLTKHDFKMLRAKKKPMEEGNDPMGGDTTSPSSMGIKKPDYATGTPDYAKPKTQTVNRAAKTSLPAGTMKEAKSNAYAIGMSAVQKSTGDKPPMKKENITKAHKIAKKIIARKKMNEGFNNRHSLSVTASADKKQTVADQLDEKVGNSLLLNKAKTGTKPKARIGDIGIRRTISGTNDVQTRLANLRKKPTALDTKRDAELDKPGLEKAGVSQALKDPKAREVLAQTTKDAANFAVTSAMTGGPLDSLIARGVVSGVTKGYGLVKNALTAGKTTATATKPVVSAAAREGGSAVPKITKGTGQGNRIAAPRKSGEGPWGSTKPPEVNPSTRLAPSGTFTANLQRARQNAQSGTVGATQQAARLAAGQRLSATAKDIGAGAGKVATGAVNAVKEYPKLAAGVAGGAALGGFAATQLGNKPAPATAATRTSDPSFEKTGRGNAPSAQTTTTQPDYDKMTFGQAFKSAREAAKKQGDASIGKFKYKGKEYQTNIKGTGTAKKPQEKYQLASKLKDVAPVSATKTPTPTQTAAKPKQATFGTK